MNETTVDFCHFCSGARPLNGGIHLLDLNWEGIITYYGDNVRMGYGDAVPLLKIIFVVATAII